MADQFQQPQFPGIPPDLVDWLQAKNWLALGGDESQSGDPASAMRALVSAAASGTMDPAYNGDGRWWGASAASGINGVPPPNGEPAFWMGGGPAGSPPGSTGINWSGDPYWGPYYGANPYVGGQNYSPLAAAAMTGSASTGASLNEPWQNNTDPSVLGAIGGGPAAGIGQPASAAYTAAGATGAVGGGFTMPQGGNYPMGSFIPGVPPGGGGMGGFAPPGGGLNPNLMGGGASGPAMPSYGGMPSQGGQTGQAVPSYGSGTGIPYPTSGIQPNGQGFPLPSTGTTVPAAGLVDPQSLLNQYQSSFNAARNANEARYNTILQGYQNMIGNQGAASQALLSGYQDRYNQVMNDINGMGASQRQDIADKYARQRGSATQSLISRGLGNTTVVDSVGRGIASDEARAGIALNDALSRERAQYRSGLLGDALQAQQAGAGVNANLTGNMLNFQERRTDSYPDANFYGNLIQQSGAQQQANANAANQQQQQQQYINYLSMFNPNYADQTRALQALYGAPLGGTGNIPGLTPQVYT